MSRWAQAFAALSEGSDTLDTMRHSEVSRSTVSQSVNSVMAFSPPLPEPSSSDCRLSGEAGAEERAAIAEYDGKIPREWAEGFARLDPDRPPADVPPRRWLQFVDDVGRFLDSRLAQQAAALGWGSFDLFGCDRDRPFARIDQAGLLWLPNGNRLVALSAEAAAVETRAGERLTYRRKRIEVGCVLAWELET